MGEANARHHDAAIDRRSRLAAPDRGATIQLAGLIALLVLYRIATANYPLWFDEFATLIFADLPLHQLWSGWMVNETNPPLVYTLVKGWQALGFHSILALRLLPILFSLAGLVLLAVAGWIGWGPRAATAAVLLAGVSPLHIYASQMLRGYMLAADGVLLAFIGLLLLLRVHAPLRQLDRRTALGGLTLYCAGSAVAIYCHTTMFLWPPIGMAALAATAGGQLLARRGQLLWQLVLAHLVLAALAGWWLGITLAQMQLGAQNVSWIRSHTLLNYIDLFARSALLVNQEYIVERLLVIVIGAATVLAMRATWSNPAARLASLIVIIGGIGFWAISKAHPIATKMSLFWFLSFVSLLIAGGLSAIRSAKAEKQARLGLVALLAANQIMHGNQLTYQDFAGAIRTVAADRGTGLLVEGATMGAVSAKACTVAFPGRPCPVPILTLKLGQDEHSWATALGSVHTLTPAQLPPALNRCCRAVYTLRTYDMDPLLDFGLRSVETRHGWNYPFIEGPIPARNFKPQDFRVSPPYWLDPNDE